MRAWIAGATGYTGSNLVRHLAAAGAEVHAHVRPESRSRPELQEEWLRAGVTTHRLPWDHEALAAALVAIEPTVVFSLLGITKKGAKQEAAASGGQAPTYQSVDLGLTLMLLEAAKASVPEARFVFLSSLGTRPSQLNAYLNTRWQAEQAIKASGVPFTIVRPSIISGPDRREARTMERFGAFIVDTGAGVLGGLGMTKTSDRIRSISGEALAKNLADLGSSPAAEGRIIEADELLR